MPQLLMTIIGSVLPILALIFVTALFVYRVYRYIRVNCWFCNGNSRVSFAEQNSWICPQCDQYNGFKEDGDYNRDLNFSRGSQNNGNNCAPVCANAYYSNELNAQPPRTSNGLCDQCNEAQRLKIEKLAQFEPTHESRYDEEINMYQALLEQQFRLCENCERHVKQTLQDRAPGNGKQLEQQFRLCGSCERHVNKVLHEKKKMVLGSKFLNFIIKGAALLKQPHFNHLARVQQQRRLQRYQMMMTLLTIVNVLGLLCSLPAATRPQFGNLLGETCGDALFFVYSHALTLLRVLVDYAGNMLLEQPLAARLLLFGGTFSKLLLYSLGLTQVQAQQATLSSCYTSLYPYAMLGLSFLHNISDGLKFTRFTLLLVLWSIYAKGSLLLAEAIDGVTFLLLGSLLTLVLLITNRGNSSLVLAHNESVGDSFHRLYADEGISDDESISMLSQQLSSHNNSHSNSMSSLNGSQQLRQRHQPHHIAPSVLSLDSLHLSSQRSPVPPQLASPVPSYRTAAAPSYAASCLDSQHPWRRMNLTPSTYGWQRGAVGGAANFSSRLAPSTLGGERPQTRSTNNLLFPARLQQQQHQRNGDISAWVNATSGTDCQRQLNIFDEPNTANLLGFCSMADKQQLSRTSSQSSGFESQLGHQNPARNEQQPFAPQPQQPQPLRAANGAFLDYYCNPEAASPRPLRVATPLASPYSTQSEIHFDRPQSNPAIQPGDLLRKWLDHNTGTKQKTNG
ncbi:hypothetical protein ACLKA7_007245 [Drosophila subpalustris]